MKKTKVEVFKYILVGSVNYVVSFAIFFGLIRLAGVNYLLSLAVVAILGVLFTYTLNYVWVFKPEKKVIFKSRLIKYFVSSFTSIILNLIILRLIVEHTQYDPLYVQVALTPVIVAFNFITAKFWSLKASINPELRVGSAFSGSVLSGSLDQLRPWTTRQTGGQAHEKDEKKSRAGI